MPSYRSAAPKNYSVWGTIRHVVEEECFGLMIHKRDAPYLVDVNCSEPKTYRAIRTICKVQLEQLLILNQTTILNNFNENLIHPIG